MEEISYSLLTGQSDSYIYEKLKCAQITFDYGEYLEGGSSLSGFAVDFHKYLLIKLIRYINLLLLKSILVYF